MSYDRAYNSILNLSKLRLMAGAMMIVAGAALAMPAPAQAASCPIKPSERTNVKWNPGHYVMLGQNNQDVMIQNFINNYKNVPSMKGMQAEHFWSELEPSKGVYNFSKIDAQIAKLAPHGKKLAITIKYKYQISDSKSSLPTYILNQPKATVNGVVVPPYFEQGKAGDGAYNEGQHANLGHPGTQAAFKNLLTALAAKYDNNPNFVSVSFLETSLGADASTAVFNLFLDGLMKVEAHAGCKFEHTPIFQNLNFPRNKLPEFTANMKKYGVGLGGPDTFWGSFNYGVQPDGKILNGLAFKGAPGYAYPGVYWYYPDMSEHVAIGQQVHYGNFFASTREDELDGKLHNLSASVSLDRIYDFAMAKLHPNYMFWQVYNQPADALEARLKTAAGLPLDMSCPPVYGGKCNAKK